MQENKPRRRYCAQDYGGKKFTEMLRNISKDVMSVKGLVNLIVLVFHGNQHRRPS
jgi:hypothetical protein